MSDDPADGVLPPTEREVPVGEPVVRGDPAITGERAERAARFDPDDPESVAHAAETVRSFFEGGDVNADDHVYMLRGAAACAALVRGVGSYKAAAERAGGEVTVSFIRKWARVHDLPQAVRRHVATGHIAPTAAKHIARVAGDARFHLAWGAIDGDLTVREVRQAASRIAKGESVDEVLEELGVTPGRIQLDLPSPQYLELRRRASMANVAPEEIVGDALEDYFQRTPDGGRALRRE